MNFHLLSVSLVFQSPVPDDTDLEIDVGLEPIL